MKNIDIIPFSQQKNKFFTLHIVAFILLSLWIFPPIHDLIKQFDTHIFLTLNAPLQTNKTWHIIWEVGSTRLFDLLVGVIMLFCLIKSDWVFEKTKTRKALFDFLGLLILLLIIRTVFSKYVEFFGLQHASPSLVVDNAFRLSEESPDYFPDSLELKDASSKSFPGDHASVLLIWAMFISIYTKKWRQLLFVWGITLFFMLPRLVAGAHWASDNYVGGLFVALLTLAWGVYTPLLEKITLYLLNITQPLFTLAQHIPILKHLSMVKYAEYSSNKK